MGDVLSGWRAGEVVILPVSPRFLLSNVGSKTWIIKWIVAVNGPRAIELLEGHLLAFLWLVLCVVYTFSVTNNFGEIYTSG